MRCTGEIRRLAEAEKANEHVSSWDLKTVSEEDDLIWGGRRFQDFGAAIGPEWAPWGVEGHQLVDCWIELDFVVHQVEMLSSLSQTVAPSGVGLSAVDVARVDV